MTKTEERVQIESRNEWRAWLEKNHERQNGIWLVTFKKHCGDKYVSYNDVVEEALCFGWIDSLPRKLDEDRTMLWMSPRKPGSAWSKLNKERVEKMTGARLIHQAGEETVEAAKQDGSWQALDLIEALEIPPDLEAAFASYPSAQQNFAEFPRGVMPDARGHGRSSTPLHGYRYEDHAGDVIALIRGPGLAAPIVLGHSMGGMAAAMVANLAAELIRGGILVDPTFLSLPRQHEVHDSDVAEQHRRLLSQDKDEVLAQVRSRHPHRSPEMVELIASARRQTRMRAFDVLTPPNPEYQPLVGTIDVPILWSVFDG